MLQLVAEHAREVVGADQCVVRLAAAGDEPEIEVETRDVEAREVVDRDGDGRALTAVLTALDGRDIGSIRLWGKHDGEFTELDEAVLAQLAQMASAAVERAQLYRR
jgi:GAF domain-containing protein